MNNSNGLVNETKNNNLGGKVMEQTLIEEAYKQYTTKNKYYIEANGLQDAVQDSFVYYLERNAKGNLQSINQSFISRGVKLAKLNQLKKKDAHVLGFDDIINTDEDIKVEDILGELDKKLQSVDFDIDIERRVEEMSKKDKRVYDIIRFYEEGYNGQQLSEMFGVSETMISRILNFQIKQLRKEKRKAINKELLKDFKTVAKLKGKTKKTYIRVKDVVLMNDGRIFSKINYFNGVKSGNEYLSYVDVVSLSDFKKVVNKISQMN